MKLKSATKLYTLVFGLFLGLAIWKFGNPVILDHKISAPATPAEFFGEPWPLHWANWILPPLGMIGGWLAFKNRKANCADTPATAGTILQRSSATLYFLPLAWLGWQFIAATHTVDADLTRATLWQFSGCVAGYFLGARVFARDQLWRWLLPGLLAAFAFCLVRGVDQHIFEFPQNYQLLTEGQRTGWTNFPPATLAEMKNENLIVNTNGLDVANPIILEKIKKGRVAGTLVYPNALAGIVLLLGPLTLALAFDSTQKLKPPVRMAVIALTLFLNGAAFFWSGSKLGWLIGLGVAGLFVLRLDWPRTLKRGAMAVVLTAGLGIFALRFQGYFAAGATSVGARLDYWRAAVQTTAAKPVFGSGPGTFQQSYAQLKSPQSEMARLTHNDYLEQFSDSGLVGGLTYAAWIFLALAAVGEKIWRRREAISFAIMAGLFGWFAQGLGEFGLYIPALAWTAFALLGCLVGLTENDQPASRQHFGEVRQG